MKKRVSETTTTETGTVPDITIPETTERRIRQQRQKQPYHQTRQQWMQMKQNRIVEGIKQIKL